MNSKILRTAYRPRARTRRRAFSLVELVVALGILLLMLSLAGQVMNLTVKSTGQATALTEINQRLRTLEESLREDLRQVDPKRSVMVIVGNPVNAYWTRNGKEADDDGDPLTGYPNNFGAIYQTPVDATVPDPMYVPTPPRADVLMFFTSRKARSAVEYDFGDPEINGRSVPSTGQLVVYGHAELGEWRPDSTGAWSLEDIVEFPKPDAPYLQYLPALPPAQSWHLARRGVLLAETDSDKFQPVPQWAICPQDTLDWEPLLEGTTDVFLLDPGLDAICSLKDPSPFLGTPCTRPGDPVCSAPWYWPEPFSANRVPYARSRLDISPPPTIRDEERNYIPAPLGAFFLPNCASFKVEWTLDPDSEAVGGRLDLESSIHWIDPGNTGPKLLDRTDDNPLIWLETARVEAEAESTAGLPPTRATYLAELLEGKLFGQGDPGWPPYSLEQRFKKQGSGWEAPPPYGDGVRMNVHVFTANRAQKPPPPLPGEQPEYLPEEIFPKALRITVDLWDANGRLDRPVRHVMVIPVGDED